MGFPVMAPRLTFSRAAERVVYSTVCLIRLPSRFRCVLGMPCASLPTVRVSHSTHRSRSWSGGNVSASSVPNSQALHSMPTTRPGLTRRWAMSLMRAGDVVRCDFGTPARGEPGFVRPAVVVTSDAVLEFRQHAIVVVPCTTTRRGWLSEVDIPIGMTDSAWPRRTCRRPSASTGSRRDDGHERRARRAATDPRTDRRPAGTLIQCRGTALAFSGNPSRSTLLGRG